VVGRPDGSKRLLGSSLTIRWPPDNHKYRPRGKPHRQILPRCDDPLARTRMIVRRRAVVGRGASASAAAGAGLSAWQPQQTIGAPLARLEPA
jgi:hypothetical protein